MQHVSGPAHTHPALGSAVSTSVTSATSGPQWRLGALPSSAADSPVSAKRRMSHTQTPIPSTPASRSLEFVAHAHHSRITIVSGVASSAASLAASPSKSPPSSVGRAGHVVVGGLTGHVVVRRAGRCGFCNSPSLLSVCTCGVCVGRKAHSLFAFLDRDGRELRRAVDVLRKRLQWPTSKTLSFCIRRVYDAP